MTALVYDSMITWAISATMILAIVLILRYLFREKISYRMRYSLWLVVLARLLIPFSIGNSDLSIQNWLPVELKTSVVQEPDSGWESSGNHYGDVVDVNDPVWNVNGETDSPVKLPDGADFVVQSGTHQSTQQGTQTGTQAGISNPLPGDSQYVSPQGTGHITQDLVDTQIQKRPVESDSTFFIVRVMLQVWRIGAMAGILWVLVVNSRFWLHLKNHRCQIGIYQGTTVYETSELISPCLFGWWKPAIYLTHQVVNDEAVFYYAVLHENCHRVHGDHIWGLLRGICLAVWWWHPLVWWAAAQSRQDCELACDEACIKLLGEDRRQEYGVALIRSLQELSHGNGNSYPGAAATLLSGKEELKVRLQALVKRPLVRYSAIMMVFLTVVLGMVMTFTGQSNTMKDPVDDISQTEEETEIKSEDILETESQPALVGPEDKMLNGTVEVETYTYPWTEQYVIQPTEEGLNIRKEILPIFSQDCLYYINKISYLHHGIDYQMVEKTQFLETVAVMEEKNFLMDLQLVYAENEIVEVYLKSDQQVTSLMDDLSLTDPDWPQRYDTLGLELYKTQQTYRADVAEMPGTETIEIATMIYNDSPLAVMIVKCATGELLYAWDIPIIQDQLTEILLVETDGVTSLMWWNRIQGSAGESYAYWVLRLDEVGMPVLSAGASYGFRYGLNQPEHVYNASQIQMFAQPLYYKYFQKATLLAGVDGAESSELYYTFRGVNAYHIDTVWAQVEAGQRAYWDANPSSRYVEPNFEEWAQILEYMEQENLVRLWLAPSEYISVIHPDCRYYVRTVIDREIYEDVSGSEFMEYVQGVRNTPVQLIYRDGMIVEMRLNSIYEGLYFADHLWEAEDGCMYESSMEAEPIYDWSEYTLKAEYRADVSDQEGLEVIRIYAGMMQQQEPTEPAAVIVVETEKGKRIYLDEVDLFGHCTESYYLGEKDGQAYLVYLYEEDRYQHGYFQYMVIRPGSQTNLLSGCGVDWRMETSSYDYFSYKSFLEWGRMADEYLTGSEGILRIKLMASQAEDYEYHWKYDLDWQAYANEILGRREGTQ